MLLNPEKTSGKFVALLLAVVQIITAALLLSVPAKAGYTIYGGGSWWDDQQATRFSIFNLTTGECEKTFDVFYNLSRQASTEGSYTALEREILEAQSINCNIIIGTGCKLNYLMEYNGNVAESVLKTTDVNTFMREMAATVSKNTDGMVKLLTPMRCQGKDSNGNYDYDDSHGLSYYLKKIRARNFQEILLQFGYYFFDSPQTKGGGYTFLGPEYVVVIEPVFWFINYYRVGEPDELFYGTPTEWAIYSESTPGRHTLSSITGDGIHSVMGSLTCVAGPLTCTPERDRTLIIGDNEKPIKIKAISDSLRNEVRGWLSRYNRDERDEIKGIDKIIFERLGVDYLTTNEMYEMSVELVSNRYHADTDSILSFKLQTNGEMEFAPPYDEMAAGGDYYGIKLELETLPESDLKLGDITLTCDGIPEAQNVSSVSTYIYDNWHTPDSGGIWKFAVHAYSSEGRLSYKSNSGTVIDPEKENSDYSFVIHVDDLRAMIEPPKNTNADDTAPAGFTAPSGEITAYTPVTEAEWNTYTAVAHKTFEGEEKVLLFRNDFSKTASMEGTAPISYGNISSSYYNRFDELVTKSGYGIGIDGICLLSGNYGAVDEGYQQGIVLYPEYGYSRYGSFVEKDGRNGYYLEKNPYSRYYNGIVNNSYSRVHFTPVWYPDGEYNIQVYMFDCWTPAGMLWDCRTYTVRIDGTIYDDWYVTHH